MSGGGTVNQKLAPLFFQGTERLLLQPQSFTTRTDQFVAGWWPTPADRYIAKREQGHRFFGNNFICRHISLLHSGKKKGRHCQKKKTATVFFFSKIFFWPESLIASPAQVKLVGAVRFQSAPIGFYDGREDTKKKKWNVTSLGRCTAHIAPSACCWPFLFFWRGFRRQKN